MKLIHWLTDHAYKRIPGVVLSSGLVRDEYIDAKPVTMNTRSWAAIREAARPLMPPMLDAVGGMTLGADPVAYAMADESMSVFSIRPEPKGRGAERDRCVVGAVRPGMRVLIVDDVITTGKSSIMAVERALAFGLDVAAVMALVDREEGGVDAILSRFTRSEVPRVICLHTLSDVRDEANVRG